MDMWSVYLALSLLGVASWAAPLENRIEADPELTAGYVEGDMIFSNDDKMRTGLRNEVYRWPNNIVYYRFGEVIDEPHRNHIRRGLDMLESVSCLRFLEAPEDQKYFVNVTVSGSGCFSYVGWLNAVQQVNYQLYPLDEGCFRLGTIMHEFLHTLGFYHTQSASNRDDYVRIAEENIQPNSLNNFAKHDETEVDDFDLVYDYGSVMHYSAYAFSKNGEMTIIPLSPEGAKVMGQRRALSPLDIARLNIMYKCPIN